MTTGAQQGHVVYALQEWLTPSSLSPLAILACRQTDRLTEANSTFYLMLKRCENDVTFDLDVTFSDGR